MKRRTENQYAVTKKEACSSLRIRPEDLILFERKADISNDAAGYTLEEFARLQNAAKHFYQVIHEETAWENDDQWFP